MDRRKDKEIKPESQEISGFAPYVSQSFCTKDSAAATVGA